MIRPLYDFPLGDHHVVIRDRQIVIVLLSASADYGGGNFCASTILLHCFLLTGITVL